MEINYSFVGFIAILSLLGLSACGVNNYVTNPEFPQRASLKHFEPLYEDKLEEGSKLVGATIYYSVEKTPENTYIYKQYYSSTMQLTHFITYSDVQRRNKDGKIVEWYDNGNKMHEGQYRNDRQDGEWKYYSYDTGHLDEYGSFKDGYRDGKWTTLDSLGNVYFERTYANSGKDWEMVYFNDEGLKTLRLVYLNGKNIRKEVLLEKEVEEKEANTEEDYKIEEEMPYLAVCKDMEGKERAACSNKTMLVHIYRNIKYPALARNNSIQGTALVRFVINKNGDIENVVVLRGLCDEIAAECKRVVNTLPKWAPGIQRDKPVNVTFNLPIKFRVE